MIKTPVVVRHRKGIYGKPIALLVQEESQYASQIYIMVNGKKINAKSIMNLMAACIKQGSEIEIKCSGDNEEACLKAAVALVESGLGE